jgi:hypothetical protein
MAHFALIENGIVTSVIVADQAFIDSGVVGDPASWVQTSYNTRGGVHYGQDGQPDGGVALRKNYAGIGMLYDQNRDAFIEQQPFSSWSINETTCIWEAPTPRPTDDNDYYWNEAALCWVVRE